MASFWETLQVDNQEMSVYSSVPAGSGPFPTVLIAHPASGVGEFTQSIADRLAEDGIRYSSTSRGLGEVYKRQNCNRFCKLTSISICYYTRICPCT